jgi:hypothetical protein
MSKGTSEKIQDYLDNYCIGGYSNGTVGASNYRYLLATYPEFVREAHTYRLGDWLRFRVPELGRGLAHKFGEFLSDLAGLDDYPIICEDTYSEIIIECEEYEVGELVREYDLDSGVVWEVLSEGEWCLEDTDGMADIYGMSMADVEGFVDEVRKRSQGWDTHYLGKGKHYAKWCGICGEVDLPSSELEVVA